MFVITVVPLRRGTVLDALSYFSAESYSPGTIVQVPIRNTLTLGLVTDVAEVSAAKTALRAATFSLRRLPVQANIQTLSEAFVSTARDLASYYAAPLGSVLYNLLAPEIRSGECPLPHTHHVIHTEREGVHVLQAPREERYRTYRSMVRETFAHGGSVLIVVPTSIEAETVTKALAQGITERLVLLTSTMPKSELKKGYTALEDFSTTKLIVTTTSYAFIERHDITLVIVESARSSYFRDQNRPYIDCRDMLRIHAGYTGRKLILGDLVVRTEDEAARRAEHYGTIGDTPKRIALSGALKSVDTKKKDDPNERFSLFAESTLTAIKAVRKAKGRVFIFSARRGLAPIVTCMDCNYIFRSPQSGAPYSLIRTEKNGVEERWFACSASGERVRAADTCPICGSWRLKERGIGIQQVYDELHTHFPNAPIVLLDHQSAKTYKRARFLHDTFYATKGAILLGTHMALPYLTETVDLSIVAHMDALLATPTWRLEEENLAFLLKLREATDGDVLVQTRTPDVPVLAHAKHATVAQFYTEELELRKSFNYPPHATFVHLTWQGEPDHVDQIESRVTSLFAEYNVAIYPNPFMTPHKPMRYALLRIPRTEWPHAEITRRLRELPPTVRIMVNPDKIV
jgi:primosomal protein N'